MLDVKQGVSCFFFAIRRRRHSYFLLSALHLACVSRRAAVQREKLIFKGTIPPAD